MLEILIHEVQRTGRSSNRKKKEYGKDWLEYLDWCKDLKYDLNNMFIYMPKNFKKVHDRTAEEFQILQDKKAAAEKK